VPQKLGQHFLISSPILERIASAVCPEPTELVIEIGPGRGALTEKLLHNDQHVIAIEVDASMVAALSARFAGHPRLEIIHASVLDVDLAQWGPVPIAGNLPYYITSPIMEKALRAGSPRSVFLIQKDVAERLTAKPGTREYGYLTAQTALFGDVRRLFDVKPGAFRPPPKVDSSVILIEPHRRDYGIADRDAFLDFLSHCFRQKRKTLRNNLLVVYARELVDSLPDAGMRAEQLPVERLAQVFLQLQHGNAA
jgi:16S rRNA (adenine1518-N6/adenine1519-N6)-dimethyltransferase